MEAGELEQACPRFAQSQALDPNTATLLNLAHCYERAERWTRAWVTYRAAGRLALSQGRQERVETAMTRAENLLAGRATLELIATGARPRVQLDDIELAPEDLGVPIPVAAGAHTLRATMKGKRSWRGQVVVEEGAHIEHALEPMVDAPPSPVPMPPPMPPASMPSALIPPRTPIPAAPPASWWTATRITAASIGGLGLAAGVIASGFGARTLALTDDIDAECPSREVCSERGIDLNDEAHRFALGSTVLFVAAGALAATSVVLFATSEDAKVVARPQPGGAEVAWRFTWD